MLIFISVAGIVNRVFSSVLPIYLPSILTRLMMSTFFVNTTLAGGFGGRLGIAAMSCLTG